MSQSSSPRDVVLDCLRRDLRRVTDADVRVGVLCGEMGCGEMKQFIENHPDLGCPYAGRPDGEDKCRMLREAYQSALRDT